MINVRDYVILVLFIYIKCEYILDWNKMWSEIYFLKKLFNLLVINVWKKLIFWIIFCVRCYLNICIIYLYNEDFNLIFFDWLRWE